MAKTPELIISKRRRLPHWTLEGSTYYITFRIQAEPLNRAETEWLLNRLKSSDQKFYDMLAATVMPDHVHVIVQLVDGQTLASTMKSMKGVTARELNQKRETRGAVWQEESWDRILRNEDEYREKLKYMWMNPVKAGLVDHPGRYWGWYLKA